MGNRLVAAISKDPKVFLLRKKTRGLKLIGACILQQVLLLSRPNLRYIVMLSEKKKIYIYIYKRPRSGTDGCQN